jgi:hypothetical protein
MNMKICAKLHLHPGFLFAQRRPGCQPEEAAASWPIAVETGWLRIMLLTIMVAAESAAAPTNTALWPYFNHTSPPSEGRLIETA